MTKHVKYDHYYNISSFMQQKIGGCEAKEGWMGFGLGQRPVGITRWKQEKNLGRRNKGK